jgi:hypothetical protein
MKLLTESDVRSAVEGALESTGTGDGSNERQELNYKWLTQALNDLLEQNQEQYERYTANSD